MCKVPLSYFQLARPNALWGWRRALISDTVTGRGLLEVQHWLQSVYPCWIGEARTALQKRSILITRFLSSPFACECWLCSVNGNSCGLDKAYVVAVSREWIVVGTLAWPRWNQNSSYTVYNLGLLPWFPYSWRSRWAPNLKVGCKIACSSAWYVLPNKNWWKVTISEAKGEKDPANIRQPVRTHGRAIAKAITELESMGRNTKD